MRCWAAVEERECVCALRAAEERKCVWRCALRVCSPTCNIKSRYAPDNILNIAGIDGGMHIGMTRASGGPVYTICAAHARAEKHAADAHLRLHLARDELLRRDRAHFRALAGLGRGERNILRLWQLDLPCDRDVWAERAVREAAVVALEG
jgi:hypothetical protein